jgi:hypothetical protein
VQAQRAGLQIEELPIRLIYNDPTRHFGGLLDDPESRYEHYLDVLRAELTAGCTPARAAHEGCRGAGAPCSTSIG